MESDVATTMSKKELRSFDTRESPILIPAGKDDGPLYRLEERVYIDQWARDRLARSRGKIEMLMVYVRNEQQEGHNFDVPAMFEQGFTTFCNLRV